MNIGSINYSDSFVDLSTSTNVFLFAYHKGGCINVLFLLFLRVQLFIPIYDINLSEIHVRDTSEQSDYIQETRDR